MNRYRALLALTALLGTMAHAESTLRIVDRPIRHMHQYQCDDANGRVQEFTLLNKLDPNYGDAVGFCDDHFYDRYELYPGMHDDCEIINGVEENDCEW